MNTMDKEEYIDSLKKSEMGVIIYNYCIDKGKSKEDSEKFVKALIVDPLYFMHCFGAAKTHFDSKFNIAYLQDEKGKIIKII